MGLLAVATAALVMAAGSAADTPVFSTTVFFRVTYRSDCTFTVAIDGGITMDSATGSGATIPPGPYQISVRTPLPDNTWDRSFCTEGIFSLTGPDVSYSGILGTDLGPYSATFNETFAPASTYTMVDASHPSSPIVFGTTAAGSSSSLLPPTPPSTATGTGSVGTDLVGSGIVPYRGSLHAAVATSDRATLMSSGKPLLSVKAGRYDIVVTDDSARGGFFVQKLDRKPTPITGVKFTGKRTVRVNLTAGKWAFFSKSARETEFVVTT